MTFTIQDTAKDLQDDTDAIAAIAQLWCQDKFQKQHELQGNQLAQSARYSHAGFGALSATQVKEAMEIAMAHTDQLVEIMARHLGEGA